MKRYFDQNILKDELNENFSIRHEEVIAVGDDSDVKTAVFVSHRLLKDSNFNKTDEALIATVVSELAVNIVRYAGQGQVLIRVIDTNESERTGVQVIAIDEGPGILDLNLAMTEHFTTHVSSLGLGLPSVKRIMDSFEINTDVGKGTCITVFKWREHDKYRLQHKNQTLAW